MIPIIDCQREGRSSDIYVGLGLSALGPVARAALVDANYYLIGRMHHRQLGWRRASMIVSPSVSMIIRIDFLDWGLCRSKISVNRFVKRKELSGN